MWVHRGVAQLVEYWSPKPWVVGSSPSAPAKQKAIGLVPMAFCFSRWLWRIELSPAVLRRLENIVENHRIGTLA